jgi:putative hemolysin
MKTKTFWLVTLLAAGVLTLAGCGKTEAPVENPDENAEIANPAAVYCEENGWTLNLEEWLCMFDDGSYCEEWSYQRWECQPGEIMYNNVSDEWFIDDVEQKTDWNGSSEIYSNEDLQAAVDTIINTIENEWQVEVEVNEVFYEGDETATANLPYCQSFNPEITECAVFSTNFHIPEQDVEMAWAFEPNTDINWWSWILGKNTAGEREILTNWFG